MLKICGLIFVTSVMICFCLVQRIKTGHVMPWSFLMGFIYGGSMIISYVLGENNK